MKKKSNTLSIFPQINLPKCEEPYFILQNKYLHIYEDRFGATILRDDHALSRIRRVHSFFSIHPLYMGFFLTTAISLATLASQIYLLSKKKLMQQHYYDV